MRTDRLENTRDYFENITEPAYRAFKSGEVTFLTIYSLAAGLYHIHEWTWLHDEPKVRQKFGAGITSAGDLWHKVVEQNVSDAGFIRDLNNAAKHAKLRFDPARAPQRGGPSTTMHHAANTHVEISGWGEGAYGVGPYGGARVAKMDEGGREVLLEPIATAVFRFWEALVDEFYPVPPITIEAGPPSANS